MTCQDDTPQVPQERQMCLLPAPPERDRADLHPDQFPQIQKENSKEQNTFRSLKSLRKQAKSAPITQTHELH